MESQPERMHQEYRQFRQYVVRWSTGGNHLRIRATGETLARIIHERNFCHGQRVAYGRNTLLQNRERWMRPTTPRN